MAVSKRTFWACRSSSLDLSSEVRLATSCSRLRLIASISSIISDIDRSVRRPIKLVVCAAADQHHELAQINRARGVGRFCDLLGDQAVHDYAPTSANEVTVMVWL